MQMMMHMQMMTMTMTDDDDVDDYDDYDYDDDDNDDDNSIVNTDNIDYLRTDGRFNSLHNIVSEKEHTHTQAVVHSQNKGVNSVWGTLAVLLPLTYDALG